MTDCPECHDCHPSVIMSQCMTAVCHLNTFLDMHFIMDLFVVEFIIVRMWGERVKGLDTSRHQTDFKILNFHLLDLEIFYRIRYLNFLLKLLL